MANLDHNGHRKRLREQYANGGTDNMPEHNVLELFLTTLIPRKDVKPIAYDLINEFGSLEGVLNADMQELMKINGIGVQSATAISLIKPMVRKAFDSTVKATKITSYSESCEFCSNMLKLEKVEKLLLITLDNDSNIINARKVSSGTGNIVMAPISELVKYITRDNASSVLLSHNHPAGSCEPSANDLNYTINLKNVLEKLDVRFLDHIICGTDGCLSVKQRIRNWN